MPEPRLSSVMMGSMAAAPVNLSAALATFADIYSPRIVGRVNDYDIRIAHAKGEHVWHVHEHTDEFFLVLDGTFAVALREADGGERTVTLRQGGHLRRAYGHRAQAVLTGRVDSHVRAVRDVQHR